MNTEALTSDEIKVWLLNWLLPRLGEDDLIGSEVRFLDSSYRADLVLATKTKLIGFEIKGPLDSLRRLATQAEAYDLMFHASYMVCREADFPAKLLPPKMGIIGIQTSPVIVREPRFRKMIPKPAAAKWLLRRDLEVLMGRTGIDVEQLRKAATQHLLAANLDQAAVKSIRQRLNRKHYAFMRELGSVVTQDDLGNLNADPKAVSLP